MPHLLPYSASKFALTGLSEGLRAELAGQGFAVTTVCPGLMRTGSTYNAMFKGQHRHEFAWFHLSNAMPGFSMSAARAARRIVDACRHGDAEVILTPARGWPSSPTASARADGAAAGAGQSPHARPETDPVYCCDTTHRYAPTSNPFSA